MKPGDFSDLILRMTGVSLAVGSIAFATHMMSNPSHPPRVTGIEHLAIYAKPSNRAAARMQQTPAQGIDTMPVGAIARGKPSAVLSSYEVLDASAEWAVVRLPEGRIARVARGGRIAGLGGVIAIERRIGGWALLTESGLIQ